jgi:hypothetical protein
MLALLLYYTSMRVACSLPDSLSISFLVHTHCINPQSFAFVAGSSHTSGIFRLCPSSAT